MYCQRFIPTGVGNIFSSAAPLYPALHSIKEYLISANLPQQARHPRTSLSGIHDFGQLEAGFHIRIASGITLLVFSGRLALTRKEYMYAMSCGKQDRMRGMDLQNKRRGGHASLGWGKRWSCEASSTSKQESIMTTKHKVARRKLRLLELVPFLPWLEHNKGGKHGN